MGAVAVAKGAHTRHVVEETVERVDNFNGNAASAMQLRADSKTVPMYT
ncbi:hypothetical protein [Nocardioides endophyticus]